jgi:hypothetical protein
MLYARPRTAIVSQRMPATGTTDVLTPMERSGIPLLRTKGPIHVLEFVFSSLFFSSPLSYSEFLEDISDSYLGAAKK